MRTIFKNNSWEKYWGSRGIIEQHSLRNNSCKDVVAVLLSLADKDSDCMEIGCGSGTYSIELAANGRKCLATDMTEGALELTKKKAKYLYNIDVPTRKVDLFNMPFPDNTFDLIFSDGVIEHLDIQKALNAMYKKLRPNGWLVTKVPSGSFLYKLAYYSLSVLDNKRIYEAWHTPEEWVSFASKANLKNVNIEKCGGIFAAMNRRFFGNSKLIAKIPNVGRIHYIFYGQK